LISILDVVVSKRDLDSDVKIGMKGTVLELFGEGNVFLVEFLDEDSPNGKVITVEPEDIEIIWHASSTSC
jgi:ethanolamine utilization protein EutP (predicted NTPase)